MEWTDYFISLRCLGEELIIHRIFSKTGDKVKCIIKEIKGNKIALSCKFDETNPWTTAADKYHVGDVVKGKVARMADFGAFVELEPGVDALLHVSQISKTRINKPADVLSIGQEVEAKIVDFNAEAKKVSLSIKALEADSADDEAETEADTEE